MLFPFVYTIVLHDCAVLTGCFLGAKCKDWHLVPVPYVKQEKEDIADVDVNSLRVQSWCRPLQRKQCHLPGNVTNVRVNVNDGDVCQGQYIVFFEDQQKQDVTGISKNEVLQYPRLPHDWMGAILVLKMQGNEACDMAERDIARVRLMMTR